MVHQFSGGSYRALKLGAAARIGFRYRGLSMACFKINEERSPANCRCSGASRLRFVLARESSLIRRCAECRLASGALYCMAFVYIQNPRSRIDDL
jgi:hypothetical protein